MRAMAECDKVSYSLPYFYSERSANFAGQSNYVESPRDFIEVANKVFQLGQRRTGLENTSSKMTDISNNNSDGSKINIKTKCTKYSNARENNIDATELNRIIGAALKNRNNNQSATPLSRPPQPQRKPLIHAKRELTIHSNSAYYNDTSCASNEDHDTIIGDRNWSNTNAKNVSPIDSPPQFTGESDVSGMSTIIPMSNLDETKRSLIHNTWIDLRFTFAFHVSQPMYIRFRIRKRAPFQSAMEALASRLGFRHSDCLIFSRVHRVQGTRESEISIGFNETAEIMGLQSNDEIRVVRNTGAVAHNPIMSSDDKPAVSPDDEQSASCRTPRGFT